MMNKGSFKSLFSFEFWQKFGKALMVVIAVMPAAGLMISIGKSIPMINPNLSPLVITGGILEQIGWGVIGNLHILFALLSVVAGPKNVQGVPLQLVSLSS